MKTRRILVVVDSSPAAQARVESALNLAGAVAAEVTAILAIHIEVPPVAASVMHGGWYMGDEILSQSREVALRSADLIRETCESVAERLRGELVWLQKEGDAVQVISEEARYHDLLLLGRPGTDDAAAGDFRGNIHSILLEAGVPCLVMPDDRPGLSRSPGRILLAWNGGRECYQAMRGAMPFLRRADEVTVLTLVEHPDEEAMARHRNGRAIDYLRTHEVNAGPLVTSREGLFTGQSLVAKTLELAPDLVVMGAYGHSRFRETILGGATRQILTHAELPVLFAH